MNANTEIKTWQERFNEHYPKARGGAENLEVGPRDFWTQAEISDLRAEVARLQAALAERDAKQAQHERAEFEKSMNAARFFPRELDFTLTKSPSGKRDEYVNTHLESAWNGWQARAALAQRVGCGEPVQWWLQDKIIAYASSEDGRANQVISKAQFDNALPKNRAMFDVPLGKLNYTNPPLRVATNELWALINEYADVKAVYMYSTERHLAKQQRQNVQSVEAEINALLAPPAAVTDADKRDAVRYRFLRAQEWFSSDICVLKEPKRVLTRGIGLGADCPSHNRLDSAIDAAIAASEQEGK